MSIFLLFVGVSLIITLVTLVQLLRDNKMDFGLEYILVIIICLVPVSSIVSINRFYDNDYSGFGLIISSCVVVIQILYVIYYFDIVDFGFSGKMDNLFALSFFVLPLIITLIYTPLYFLNNKEVAFSENLNRVDIAELESSIASIGSTMGQLESTVKEEVLNINKISTEIIVQINEKKDELNQIEIEQAKLRKEVEYYKKLANLSKEDASLILELVRKDKEGGKYFDYLLGFLFGVIGSILANFIYKVLEAKVG